MFGKVFHEHRILNSWPTLFILALAAFTSCEFAKNSKPEERSESQSMELEGYSEVKSQCKLPNDKSCQTTWKCYATGDCGTKFRKSVEKKSSAKELSLAKKSKADKKSAPKKESAEALIEKLPGYDKVQSKCKLSDENRCRAVWKDFTSGVSTSSKFKSKTGFFVHGSQGDCEAAGCEWQDEDDQREYICRCNGEQYGEDEEELCFEVHGGIADWQCKFEGELVPGQCLEDNCNNGSEPEPEPEPETTEPEPEPETEEPEPETNEPE